MHTCVPFDPESKGGSEATVRIAKTAPMPTSVNLREKYGGFAELRGACAIFCRQVTPKRPLPQRAGAFRWARPRSHGQQ
ncbi:hypothetical protein [Streptomyces sp. NBC_00019]|uniref:hypothetical protein n=1 Tax=Streptomyces sp. NBC_00019 TaxID=2975623 RepID=UPI0038684DD6